MKHYLFLILTIFACLRSYAQDPFPFLDRSNKVPKDLLSNRAVVFMNVNALNWDIEAKIIHKSFVKIGIDAVAYYALSDIMSGKDATNAFYKDISSRSIQSLLLVHQSQDGYELYATKMPADGGFFKQGMEAFFLEAPALQELAEKLELQIKQAGLERENFLIIDLPETFKRTHVIKGRRVAAYNPDIRIDKLAVPKFENNPVDNFDADEENVALDSIMQQYYPFKYGLVDANMTAQEMINDGYLLVLKKLQNNGESLRRMLGYELKDEETILISERKGENEKVTKYGIEEHVHKYYVQQLYTKDIYLGEVWDAAENWQEALINHVENVKTKLKK